MCHSGRYETAPGVSMDDELDSTFSAAAVLLELAACDDLPGFRRAVEQLGAAVHAPAPWYGPRQGSKGGGGMGYEMRTALQVAALYGSVEVMGYVLSKCSVEDVNRACGSDGATALHCAAAGGAPGSREAILMLLNASADAEAVDAAGRRPADLIRRRIRMRQAELEGLLLRNHHPAAAACGDEREEDAASWSSSSSSSPSTPASPPQKKEYPPDSTLPDIASGLYSTDEFRMYVYKVAPCPRAYSHDWTDCPFAHPGENARRRDPRRLPYYSPAPCPDFRRSAAVSGAAAATCPRGDGCEFAHGVFESWLHPAQYRTRMCKDEGSCGRRVCFFAHSQEQLRQPVEALDLGVISAMGLLGPQQQQQQQQAQLKAAVTNELDTGYSPRAKQQAQQLMPSGYRTPTRFHGGASTTPCSPRTPRTPAPVPSFGGIEHKCHSPAPHPRSRAGAAAAFASNRSLSFSAARSCSRAAAQSRLYLPAVPSLSGWGSADGKLDWGIKGEDLTQLRKGTASGSERDQQQPVLTEPDVSWVQSIVIDGPSGAAEDCLDAGGLLRFHSGGGLSPCGAGDHLYLEHEQLVA